MYRRFPLLVLFFLLFVTAKADANIEGLWLTADGDGWVDIVLQEDGPVGRIVGSPIEQPERFDELNPYPDLRTRSLMNLVILKGFRPDGDGKWKGGTIYDPNSGNTYRCKIELLGDGTLKVRGYIGLAFFGRTEIWTRVISDQNL